MTAEEIVTLLDKGVLVSKTFNMMVKDKQQTNSEFVLAFDVEHSGVLSALIQMTISEYHINTHSNKSIICHHFSMLEINQVDATNLHVWFSGVVMNRQDFKLQSSVESKLNPGSLIETYYAFHTNT